MAKLKFICPECGVSLETDADSSGLQLDCPSCRQPIVVPRPSRIRVSNETPADAPRVAADREETLYQCRVAMFRNHPFGFILAVLLAPVGVGLIVLLVWWIRTLGVKLTVTNRRTILEKGIFSTFSTEVFHADVRNLQVRQTFLQRMTNVGFIGISSAGQEGIEIAVDGVPKPGRIKWLIEQHR